MQNVVPLTQPEFTVTKAFAVQGDCLDFDATLTHDTATRELLSVNFCDRRTDERVSVPAWAWKALVEAVEAQKEF